MEPGPLPTDRLTILRRLVDAVAERGRGSTLVLEVDDAHLLDEGASAVVHQLAATGTARLLVTIRTGEPLPDPITALWKDRLCQRLDVQALAVAEVTELVERVLGGPVEPTSTKRLWALTQGNPLFLRQLITDALADGTLMAARGVWRWSGGTTPGPRLAELVDARLGRVDGPSLRAVQLLALAEPLLLDALVELTDTDSVAHLERQAIVSIEPGPGGAEVRLWASHSRSRRRWRAATAAPPLARSSSMNPSSLPSPRST